LFWAHHPKRPVTSPKMCPTLPTSLHATCSTIGLRGNHAQCAPPPLPTSYAGCPGAPMSMWSTRATPRPSPLLLLAAPRSSLALELGTPAPWSPSPWRAAELSGRAGSSSSTPPHPQPSMEPPISLRAIPPTLFLRPRPPLESLVVEAARLPAAVMRGQASPGRPHPS
jgi:hypothetical protein